MYETGGVGRLQGRSELAGDGHGLGKGQLAIRLASHAIGQRFSVVERHGDEPPAFALADLVDRADVGMVERGGGLSLAAKADLVAGPALQLRVQELEGDLAVQLQVPCPEDAAHAAAADPSQDAEVGDLLAGGRLVLAGSRPPRHPFDLRGAGGGQSGAAGLAPAVELRVGRAARGAEEGLHQAPSGRPPREPRAARWRASSFCR